MSRLPSYAAALTATLTATVVLVSGCSGGDEGTTPGATSTPTTPSTSSTATASPSPTPTAPPTATPVRSPARGACYDLTYAQALSPTSGAAAGSCRTAHTSETYDVGLIDNVADGHLLAVDSAQVQDDVASRCPAALGDAVGGTLEDQRLSILRSVWFTPSLGQSSKGAAWYRCDVVALAGAESLVDVRGSLLGVLDDDEGRDRYGMCSGVRPDQDAFERVPCSAPHAWRAFTTITFDGDRYPGSEAVADAASGCQDDVVEFVDDPLDYEWASEGPDADQWAAGQTFIRCWAPD